jgi:GDP-4-dehydro-6-deoxy-D-mannose reductase
MNESLNARAPLITGATGFAGRHLVAQLLETEPRVHAWGRPGGAPVGGGADDRVIWRAVDMLDREAVRRAVEEARPSTIYHLAGAADVHRATVSSAPALRVNVIGTHNLLDAVEAAGLDIPIVVTSSALVYKPSADALTEDSALGPSGPYGVSKLAQEMLAMRAALPRVLVARPFNHAGPGQSDAYVTSSFARQIAEVEAGQRPPVLRVGNLDSRRDITDVRDTVRAYRLLAANGHPQRPYNICSNRSHRVGDLLDRLVSLARTKIAVELDPARLRPADDPVVLGSFARVEAETGWRPEIPIERTLSDLLDSWRVATRAPR